MGWESLSLVLLLAAAAAPFVLRVGSVARRIAIGAASLTGCATIAWAMTAYHEPPAREREVTERPIRAPQDGYVSSDTCRSCHPREYATWHASHHRTMTQVVTPDTLPAPLDGVEMTYRDKGFRFEERGDEVWVEIRPAAWTGEGLPPSEWKQVVMSTGSHHFQAYWVSEDGPELTLLEPVYMLEEGRLSNVFSIFLWPPDKLRRLDENQWNRVCSECHTTHPMRGEDSRSSINVSAAEFGIGCESCHGPAEEHVRVNRSPARRYQLHLTDGSDETIVNPAKLTKRLSAHTCGQCHSTTTRPHSAFRPGQDLFTTRSLGYFGTERQWPDGMVRVNGRELNGLLASPCFEHATAEAETLTCLSCHSMHPQANDPRTPEEWADDQLKPNMRGPAACLPCHAKYAEAEALKAHTHHAPSSSGSNCYNCHMPNTTFGMMKATRSHQIDNPNIRVNLETGRPNACNLCHLDRTLAWTSEQLASWYGHEQHRLPAEVAEIAASVLWTIKGDAAQRALVTWHMGWEPALQASGSDWTVPYLSLLMKDSYHAIRFMAWRALRARPGYSDLTFDYIAPSEERSAPVDAFQRWKTGAGDPDRMTGRHLLISADGHWQQREVLTLLKSRDNTRITLLE